MRKISAWASHHKWAARFIIIGIYPVINLLAIITGILLYQLNIEISFAWMLIFMITSIVAIFLYPHRKQKHTKFTATAFYVRQKSCDLLLGLTTFLMVMFIVNRLNTQLPFYERLMGASVSEFSMPKDSTAHLYKTIPEFKAMMTNENGQSLKWKEKKKLLKKQVRAIKDDNELTNGEKFLLIFLSCLVATGLLFLLASLACELSCAGSEALAILVMLVGTGLLVFLLIRVIKKIVGKTRKKAEENTVEPKGN